MRIARRPPLEIITMNTTGNLEELAFVNLQLAGMLREGLPIEGSLQHLCAQMKRGALRAELRLLETDLAAGAPLVEAAEKRRLPLLYQQMLKVGVRSNSLPEILVMLADYYQTSLHSWRRLQGLLVYPLMVLILACFLSVWFGFLTQHYYSNAAGHLSPLGTSLREFFGRAAQSPAAQAQKVWRFRFFSWGPPAVLIGVTGAMLVGMVCPGLRRRLSWRLSPFRETNLSQFAGAMHILLQGGCALPDAVKLMAELEQDSPAGRDVSTWLDRLTEGRGKWIEMARDSVIFKPMFVWIVGSAGDNLASGFQRAAELYRQRALHRRDLILYAAMPACLLFLGLIIAAQIFPFMTHFWDVLDLSHIYEWTW